MRGKQKIEREGIWYTAQSGIWQSVWMEIVPEAYMQTLTLKGSCGRRTVHSRGNRRRQAERQTAYRRNGSCGWHDCCGRAVCGRHAQGAYGNRNAGRALMVA